MARVVLVLSLLLAASVLAGCVEESAPLTPFESLVAPAWEAGYTWTWQAQQSGTWTYSGEDGEGSSSGTETHQIVHTVVNTVETAFDTPVYWVRSSERIGTDGPIEDGVFGHEGLQALAKTDLHPVAYGHEQSFYGPFDDCGTESLSLYRTDPFPYLRFPLERGATWQGELEDHVTMQAEVVGAREVVVPAGTFDAVEVRLVVDVAAGFFDEQEEVQSVSAATTVWYAEEIRNIVRLESEMEVHFMEGDENEGSMASDTIIELASFALVAGTEEQLPRIQHAYDPYRDDFRRAIPQLYLATNASFPLNAATDPLEVTFGLTTEEGPQMEGTHGMVSVAQVPTELPWLDDENQTVRWTLMSQETYETVTGPTATWTVPPGGFYDVMAQLVPKVEPAAEPMKCEADVVTVESSDGMVVRSMPVPHRMHPQYHLASGGFSVEWHQEFEASHTGIQEARHQVAEVPLVAGGHLTAFYDVSTTGTFPDQGQLVVRFANGDEARLDEAGLGISPDRAGPAIIEWVAEGRFAGLTFGHDVEGTIDVYY